MKTGYLIILLFISIAGNAQESHFDEIRETTSFYYSYEIIEVMNDSLISDADEYADVENVSFDYYEVLVKKKIGHLGEINLEGLNETEDSSSSAIDPIYNGYVDFGNYKGNFINGKQDGEWIYLKIIENPKFINNKRVGEVTDTITYHELYTNGLADGQWFRYKNKMKQNTYNFKEGKLDGEIIEYFDDYFIRKTEIKTNFKDGIRHGFFSRIDNSYANDGSRFYDSITGSFNLGIPIGKWEIVSSRKAFVGYTLYNENGEKLKERVFESKQENKEVEYERPCKTFVIQKLDDPQAYETLDINSVLSMYNELKLRSQKRCGNYKETQFYKSDKFEDSRIETISYYGSDEYREGKKFLAFYSNGKIKQEGVINQYRKEYDINGKLIRSSTQFNSLWDGIH